MTAPGSRYILHIASAADWAHARATWSYAADSLATEGFIHCSTPAQVLGPANALFRGRVDLLLLVLDPTRIRAEIRYEGAPGGEQFPHVYGPVDLDAVVRAVPFPAEADGSFRLPAGLGL
jgi:uncharacterized protein (DUF952 family)